MQIHPLGVLWGRLAFIFCSLLLGPFLRPSVFWDHLCPELLSAIYTRMGPSVPKIFRGDFFTRMGPSVPKIFRGDFFTRMGPSVPKRFRGDFFTPMEPSVPVMFRGDFFTLVGSSVPEIFSFKWVHSYLGPFCPEVLLGVLVFTPAWHGSYVPECFYEGDFYLEVTVFCGEVILPVFFLNLLLLLFFSLFSFFGCIPVRDVVRILCLIPCSSAAIDQPRPGNSACFESGRHHSYLFGWL